MLALERMLAPIGTFCVVARLYCLTEMPYWLYLAVVSTNRCCQRFKKGVARDWKTVRALNAQQGVTVALGGLRGTTFAAPAELKNVIGQISGDLLTTLDTSGDNMSALVQSMSAWPVTLLR